MRRISNSEKQVLESLIHIESMDTLTQETGMPYGPLRDDITNLISARYIEVFSENATGTGYQKTPFFDLDQLARYFFRATNQGLTALRIFR